MKHACHGYTLLELLMATGVAAVLLLTCGMVIHAGSGDQREISERVRLERQARQVFEQLAEDLAVATSRRWFQGSGLGDCDAGWFILRRLTSQSPEQALGDLCSVGYALRRDDSARNPDEVPGELIRVQHDSALVYRAIELGDESSLWKLGSGEQLLAEEVLEFEIWPMIRMSDDHWQPWHSGLREVPDAVEARLVLAGKPSREFETLIHLGIDAH